MALATVGLGLLVYPLVQGQNSGWPAWTFVCLALSPVVLAVFVTYERSLPSTRFPLVQLSLFKIPSFHRACDNHTGCPVGSVRGRTTMMSVAAKSSPVHSTGCPVRSASA